MKNNFKEIGIKKELSDILLKERIDTPTPIQEESIPEILEGKDIIGEAQTGTGKTLAFLLPIVQKINRDKNQVQALIIAPTRELAIQLTDEAKKLGKPLGINTLSVYGGQDVFKQLRKLKNGVHIVVATPGRLLDHISRKSINLGHTEFLVLDEADEILNMGFLIDVERIISSIPKRRQTLMFSATIPKGLKNLAKKYMKSPETIRVEKERVVLDEIEQIIVRTTDREKEAELVKILREERPFMAIIFCRTKRRVKELNEKLKDHGFTSDEVHGDLSQNKRERVMESFRKMEIPVLVATDVAARGLDIAGVTHIINYDIPENPDAYIHRIGRTGRAGDEGKAYTFVTPKVEEELRDIEKKIKEELDGKKQKPNRSKNRGKGKGKNYRSKKEKYKGKNYKSNKKKRGGRI